MSSPSESGAVALDAPQALPRATLMAVIALTAVAVALESWLSPVGAPIVVAGTAALVTLALLIDRDRLHAVLLLAFVCLAATQATEELAITQPIRIFVADLAMLPLLTIGAVRLVVHRRLPPLAVHYGAIVFLGVALTLLGIELGNAPLDAVGVFRRMCIYPGIYIVVAAGIPFPPTAARDFRRVAVLAGLVVAGLSAYRLATGEGYAHEYFEQDQAAARFLSYVEAIAPTLALLLLLSENTGTRSRKRPRNLVLMWLLLMGLVVSNYRAVWGGLAAGLLVWAYVGGRDARSVLRHVLQLIGLGLIAAVAVLWITNPEALPLEKFSLDNLQRASNWRLGSWSRALEIFRDSPLFGVGFGYQHRFLYLTGENFDVWNVSEGHTIHNDLLWVLTNAGLVGAVLIVGLHARWWRLCRAALGTAALQTESGRVIAAILGTHAAVVVLAMFQPVFSSASAAIVIYLMMGFAAGLACRLARPQKEPQ